MNVGNLDRRITIQTRDATRTAAGAQANTWTNLVSVYAKKKDVPSVRRGEMFAGDQHSDSLYCEWTIRYIAGLTGAERIVDQYGTVFTITGIPSEVGRREYLVIVSERGVVKS